MHILDNLMNVSVFVFTAILKVLFGLFYSLEVLFSHILLSISSCFSLITRIMAIVSQVSGNHNSATVWFDNDSRKVRQLTILPIVRFSTGECASFWPRLAFCSAENSHCAGTWFSHKFVALSLLLDSLMTVAGIKFLMLIKIYHTT